MPDYKAMYIELFRSQTKVINILQEAQRQTEEMYIESGDTEIIPFTVLKQEADPKNPDKKE